MTPNTAATVVLRVLRPFRFNYRSGGARAFELQKCSPELLASGDGIKQPWLPREFHLDPNDPADREVLAHPWIRDYYADGCIERPDQTRARIEDDAALAAERAERLRNLRLETERQRPPDVVVDAAEVAEALKAIASVPEVAQQLEGAQAIEIISQGILWHHERLARLSDLLVRLESGVSTPLNALNLRQKTPSPVRVTRALEIAGGIARDDLNTPLPTLRARLTSSPLQGAAA